MRKIIVILYGPPGAGKGTQANLLADKLELIHFDTGRFLEHIVHDPKRQKEKIVKRERALFDGGKLMTPSFVTGEVLRGAERIAAADWGLIFSGSPRTMYEAEKEYPVFEKLYGKKNIFIFVLEVPPAESIRRNSARMVCRSCGYLLLTSFYPGHKAKRCPVCAGSFYKRSLDKPSVIKVRLKEYEERTFPIFKFAKKRGYRVIRIDARPAPFKVTERIYAHIKKA
jgi:adenylate kinase